MDTAQRNRIEALYYEMYDMLMAYGRSVLTTPCRNCWQRFWSCLWA